MGLESSGDVPLACISTNLASGSIEDDAGFSVAIFSSGKFRICRASEPLCHNAVRHPIRLKYPKILVFSIARSD